MTPPLCLPTVEKLQAAFTVLRAFGCVSTGHSRRATRFAMVMSLDISATGRVTAAQLQVRLREGQGLHEAQPSRMLKAASMVWLRGRGAMQYKQNPGASWHTC